MASSYGTSIRRCLPRWSYSLSERGRTLMPVLQALCTWGTEHIDD